MIGQTDHATYTPALSYHPLANLFPMIEGPERVAFRQSIRDKGLRVKIVMHEEKILDGRNRYRELLGLQLVEHGTDWKASPYFRAFGSEETDGDDPLAFVLDLNLDRRHLNESQRASVAARMATMTRGERTDLQEGSSLATGFEKTSRAEAAERLNVSERSVNSAKHVQEAGSAELIDAVDQGVLPVSVAEKLLTLPVAEQTRLVQEETPAVIRNAAKKAQRSDKEQKLAAKQKALPNKRFGVIYVDPAWRFEPRNRETGLDRSADNHYPTMTTEEIMALPVGDLAAPDCAMFMWATVPMLTDALKTLSSWGFTYKSHYIWDKTPWDGDGADNEIAGRQGQGFWSRVNHELLLIGTRGSPTCPAPGENMPSVYREVASDHSAKPEYYARMIESYYPNMPKIELNARDKREGWEVWGNESEGKAGLPTPPAPGASIEFEVPELPEGFSAGFKVTALNGGKYGQRQQFHWPLDQQKTAFEFIAPLDSFVEALTVAVRGLQVSMLLLSKSAGDEYDGGYRDAAEIAYARLEIWAVKWGLGKVGAELTPSPTDQPAVKLAPKNTYIASLSKAGATDGLTFRRTPAGEPTVADLVLPGTVVTTSYSTGPFIVLRVSGPHHYAPDRDVFACGISAEEAAVATDRVFPHYSLIMVGEADFLAKPSKKTLKETSYINEVVASGGRLLKLFENNTDETIVTGFNADAALLLGASTEQPKTFEHFVQVDPCPERWRAVAPVEGKPNVLAQYLLEMKIIWALMAGMPVSEGPAVRELMAAGCIHRSGGELELTQRGYAEAERLGDLVKAATDPDGNVYVAELAIEKVDPAHIEEPVVSGAYIEELQKVAHLHGELHQSTAEPVMRAAYAERIPIAQIETDLGHPKGTIKTWANRLKLTSIDRMHETQAPQFTTADGFDQMSAEVPDINGDAVRAGLKVTLTEDVVSTEYEVRRVYKNGNISISNADGHQRVIKAGDFVLAYAEEAAE